MGLDVLMVRRGNAFGIQQRRNLYLLVSVLEIDRAIKGVHSDSAPGWMGGMLRLKNVWLIFITY